MNRRNALTTLLGTLALTGCDSSSEPVETVSDALPQPGAPPTEEPSVDEPEERRALPEGWNLTPPDVRPEIVTRVTVGLRPFRPAGFVIRKDDLAGKVLIHNYGHGGGGMTLSWGCANQAVNLAEDLQGKECAVIGGGVMGLSVARLLQLRGAGRVTIYSRDLTPATTSNLSGAQWWPVSVYSSSQRTPEFSGRFVDAARFSYRYFQNLIGPKWGVRWIPNYYLSSTPPENGFLSGPGAALHDLQVDFKDFGPGEHVFPAEYVRRFWTMLIEPNTYLSTLLSEVTAAGANVEIRAFSTAEEIGALAQPVIFNCTGLGSRELFQDQDLVPARGQLNIVLPQPDVNFNLISDLIYMFPRSDGIVLGGSWGRNNWNLEPSESDTNRILEGHRAVFDQMRANIAAAISQDAVI